MAKKEEVNGRKLDFVSFAEAFIRKFRRSGSKGIHLPYSGFSETAQAYFNLSKEEIRSLTDQAVKAGSLEGHPCRGGFMLYAKGEKPGADSSVKAAARLKEMGL